MPHRLPSTPSEPTLPTPRPLPLRSLPSSSSESAVSRRRLVSLRPVVSCLLGMWRPPVKLLSGTSKQQLGKQYYNTVEMHATREAQREKESLWDQCFFFNLLTGAHSDGIARVHGMANVQAEELVEYVEMSLPCLRQLASNAA